MSGLVRICIQLLISSVFCVQFTSAQVVPYYDRYVDDVAAEVISKSSPVLDRANFLSPEEHRSLQKLLVDYERAAGVAVVVITLQNLSGGQIEDYANRLFERIGIGAEGEDRGVLLLISKGDRKLRIETGYGIEAYLTDVEAGQIIRNVITPEFRERRYANGILSGVTSIVEDLSPGFIDSYANGQFQSFRSQNRRELKDNWFPVFVVIVMIAFALLTVFNSPKRRRRGRDGRWIFTDGGFLGGSGGGGFSGGGGGFGGFGGFGGGMSGGGGASGSW